MTKSIQQLTPAEQARFSELTDEIISLFQQLYTKRLELARILQNKDLQAEALFRLRQLASASGYPTPTLRGH
jgi:hypothetical protein